MKRFSYAIGMLVLLGGLGGCGLDKQGEQSIKDHDTDNDKHIAAAKPAPSPRINPLTHLAAGQMLEKQGDFKGALDQYEKAVAANPKLPSGYNRLGVIYQKMGRFADAEKIFRVGIDANPNAPGLRNNLGYCFLAQRRFDDAEEQFTAALAIAPNYKRAHMNLGIAYAQTGKMDKGLSEFKRVVTVDSAHYNLAVICLAAGDYTNAERALKNALAVNPKLTNAQQKLDELHALAQGGPNATDPNSRIQMTNARNGMSVTVPQIPLAGTADDEIAVPK